jgi:hypothetical protein
MDEYAPLDLSPYHNAGVPLLWAAAPPIGAQQFRGLPFLIGEDPERCFVAFGEERRQEPLTLGIGQVVRSVIVAHRLLESRILDGGPMGEPIAEYVFRYCDGEEVRAPIRDGFEIRFVSGAWGENAFSAVYSQGAGLPPRYRGAFEDVGARQTEVDAPWPADYYLWAWLNPRPEQSIDVMTITPSGSAFFVAGITLGHADEHPFVRTGARPVTITLTDPETATRPFKVAVEVDRGTASFAYPLPERPADAFLDDPFVGWGEAPNEASSPAYSRIAATPSATVTVKHGDEVLAQARWSELTEETLVETPRVRFELADPGRNWVRTTVVDDETGKPIPCRIHFRSPEGIPYQPHGHHGHVFGDMGTWHLDVGGDVRLGQVSYAYIDGTCEGWLPRGEVIVDIARGFEYEPLRRRLTLAPGQQDLVLRLKRWIDLRARGWYSGDTQVHFLSTRGSHLEAQGEDLNVVNLLQSQWGGLFTNTEEFTGSPSVSSDGRTVVYASQENRQHLLGHLSLLGLKRGVMPWCSDGPDEAELGGTLETTLSHWADACHAQGGTVILPHMPSPNGEPAALVATGRVDGVEMLTHGMYNHLEYYRYLNCGYRLPLVGGTDKMSADVPVGLYRTYVHIPADEEFTYDSWCRGLAAGRTFLSGGPIISLTVDGHAIGDTVQLPKGGGTLEVEAWAESIFPIHTLEIVQNGRVVAVAQDQHGARQLRIKDSLKVGAHTWLAARVGGPGYVQTIAHHDGWSRGVMAHTSPVYVACGDDWRMFDPQTAQYMLTLIDGSLTYIRDLSPQHRPGTVTHHHGEQDHLAYLERPFLQAREALHRRLHAAGIDH